MDDFLVNLFLLFIVAQAIMILLLNSSNFVARLVALLIGAPGIILHEIGHLLPSLVFKVEIEKTRLLYFQKMRPAGEINLGSLPPHAFACIIITFGPSLIAFPASILILEGIEFFNVNPQQSFNISFLLLFLVVGISAASAPSNADIRLLINFIRAHLGESFLTIAGFLVGITAIFLLKIRTLGIFSLFLIFILLFIFPWLINKLYLRARRK
ncbi:MAG: hypothetical protein ACTSYS_01605 [Promethearchaeota archaeon]